MRSNKFLAYNNFKVCAIISLFNFSCLFAITFLTYCEITKLEITPLVMYHHASYERRLDSDSNLFTLEDYSAKRVP